MNNTEKVIWLLKRLGEPPFEMGVTELAREMGVGKSGVYKILKILSREGFVSQNYSTKKYYLGPALYRLGQIYSDKKGIWEIAEPVMKALNKLTQETVSIGIREGDHAILAYKVESPYEIRLSKKIGKIFPINAGAIGKLLAAYHDINRIKILLEKTELVKKNPNTITDKEELLKEYEIIKDRGYALSDEENALGAFGISAPIRDIYGNVWACLCLAGPKERFSERKIKKWISLIINSADEISYRLGYENE